MIANLTVVNPAAAGSAVVYASNATQPAVTSSTWAAGQTVGTLVTTKLGADGYIKITNTSAGTIDVAVDVQGWYSTGTPTTGTVLTAVNPARVESTVAPTTGTCSPSPCTAWTTTAGTKDVKIAGLGGVPATGVAAVAVTITVTNNSTTATDTVTAWAGGSASAQPANVTNLTIAPGQTLSNEAVVPLTGWLAAPQGYINLNTSTASDVRIDVNGYYNGADAVYNYTYDPDGQRASKASLNGTANYTWDRTSAIPQLLAETNLSGATTSYIYGPDGAPVEQINPAGTVYWYHADRQGSIRTVTNSTGATIDTNTYDPYGKPSGHTGTATVPFGYTDTETGNLYLQHRYYDPTTGQFLTRDPLNAATRSAYGYVGNDPLSGRDPSGLCSMNPFSDDDCYTSAAKAVGHLGLDLAAVLPYANYYALHSISMHVNQIGCSSGWGALRTATCSLARIGNIGSGVLQVANLGADEILDETKQACGLVPSTYSNDDEGQDILLLPRQVPGPNPVVHDAPGVRHGGGPWDWDIEW